MNRAAGREHGGGVDAAAARHGGARDDWLDLSTGINPVPYPVGPLPAAVWAGLPDSAAEARLVAAARAFWGVPEAAAVLAAPGASALIAKIPGLASPGRAAIPAPTYNEHAAAFAAHGWQVAEEEGAIAGADAVVAVHPNNPDGRLWAAEEIPEGPLTVIDESFADTMPETSLIALAARPRTLILKSFGKFWGLAGLRLGFAIGDPALLARLAEWLGPWPVSGPALALGARALADTAWADATRARLAEDAARLDALVRRDGVRLEGGTPLFRLYDVGEAGAWHEWLAERRILARSFADAPRWLRLGLPGTEQHWTRLEAAL